MVDSKVKLSASDDLEGFFSSPQDNPPKWLLVLYAYFDESGHEQEDRWMCVGGLYGNEDQWKTVPDLWRAAIKPRTHLHMSDLRFKRDREKRTLERAGAVPAQAGLKPAFAVVRVADYKDLVENTPDARRLKGYMVCCYGLVMNVLRGIPKNERIEIVFEDQKEYRHMALLAMSAIAQCVEWDELLTDSGLSKLAKWSFVPKGSTVLLEPADCFVYAVTQARRDRKSLRAKWSSPILKTNGGDALGAIMDRERARTIIRSLVR